MDEFKTNLPDHHAVNSLISCVCATDNSSDHWYLGIWYNQISLHTTVWVANREAPITDPASSQLSISSDGNMVILDHRRSAVWSTNVTGVAPNSTVGVILDSGNLVLADASNTSVVRWQSFDHFGNHCSAWEEAPSGAAGGRARRRAEDWRAARPRAGRATRSPPSKHLQ